MALSLFWFRRDLRIEDNAALYHALKNEKRVQPIFIFDRDILDKLEDRDDRRLRFIHFYVTRLKRELEKQGSTLWVFYGKPEDVFAQLITQHDVAALYANRDYEPYARMRDKAVFDLLKARKIPFRAFKDHVIFEKEEVTKDDGDPYVVFTPYSKKWKEKCGAFYLKSYPSKEYLFDLNQTTPTKMPSLAEMQFKAGEPDWPDAEIDTATIEQYHETRDIPAIQGTTRLSAHLRFGIVSIRTLARLGYDLNEKWLIELIWRDFYQMILWHYPRVVDQSFRPNYDRIAWRNNEQEFTVWCQGNTGYPIVDAGMRELNATGFIHNRVRMIVASFLTKHLLIDWRWGEAYFAQKLLDFELASNNGGWQWAAGSGADAAPYFRVFNPYLQTKKFDPELIYIKKWVPEFQRPTYPQPIVEHAFARQRAISTFKEGFA